LLAPRNISWFGFEHLPCCALYLATARVKTRAFFLFFIRPLVPQQGVGGNGALNRLERPGSPAVKNLHSLDVTRRGFREERDFPECARVPAAKNSVRVRRARGGG